MSVEAIDIDLTDPETAKAATTIQVLKLTLLINFLRGPFINCVHSGRCYYIDLLLIKLAVVTMFREIWSQIKIPYTNRQQFPNCTGLSPNQVLKN